MPEEPYSLERHRDVVKAAIHRLISSGDAWDQASTHSEQSEGHEPIATVQETLAGLLSDKTITPAGLKAALDALKGGVSAEHDTLAKISAALSGLALGDHSHANATDSEAGFMAPADKAKLDGIEAGATGDQSPAEIKTAYESNADTNPFTDSAQAKLAGIESGATGDQTGAEIKAAYEAEPNTNPFTDSEKAKLAAIEAGATADQTPAEIKTAYESNANTNAFTDAEKAKLAALEDSFFLGTFLTVEALTTAHPAPAEGSFAHVDAGAGSELTVYIWDASDNIFRAQQSGSGAETAASVKTKYESNPDTNAFTDSEKTKLAGVEAGATADQSGAEIKAAYEAEADTNAFTDAEKAKLANVPADTNAALAGKSNTGHTHAIADTTGLQSALDAKAPQSALDAHSGDTANPHGVTKAQVGLGNADNTSDADKPVSTAQQAALDGKVNVGAFANTQVITQAAYDALGTPDASTLYLISG